MIKNINIQIFPYIDIFSTSEKKSYGIILMNERHKMLS